jgi:hypothetical protein
MLGSEPGTARHEAERLVATAVAAARLAAGAAGYGTAGRCCACPLCRAVAALREPDPRVVERLATRAGDLAAGVAGLLRSASARQEQPTGAASDDEVWREATRAGQTGAPRRPDDAWAAATRADGDRAVPGNDA